MRSPCFVHSKLQGPSFTEWLREKHEKGQGVKNDGQLKGADASRVGLSYSDGDISEAANGQVYYGSDDEDEETASSLTKQLAETAVGVREMSKQLGAYSSFQTSRINLTAIIRSHTRSFEYPEHSHSYESER